MILMVGGIGANTCFLVVRKCTTVHFGTALRRHEAVPLQQMAVSHHRPVTHIKCPTCHWAKAVLAYENSGKRCFLCPHCQHVWDVTETRQQDHSSGAHT